MRQRTLEYLEGCETVESILELDTLTFLEVANALDPEREDPLLNPWRRYNAALREALGH